MKILTGKAKSALSPIFNKHVDKDLEKALPVANNPEAAANETTPATDEVPAFADPNLHRTRAGAWPQRGPTPSKLAVVLYYISCTFVVFGCIVFVRSFFYAAVGKIINF